MSRYTVNVTTSGQHFCNIHLPEILESLAIAKAKLISKAFGAAYECTLTRWNATGQTIKLVSDDVREPRTGAGSLD